MSILIKSMGMPTAGMCKTITIFDDGAVVEGNGSEKLGIAVPVPPHGRLIDADALAVHKFAGAEHDISIADGGACYRRGWNDAIEAIMENAETIIGEK